MSARRKPRMFASGSKASARRIKADARRARIRALRIAERQLRPHGWRVESVRRSPSTRETMVDVQAVAPMRWGPRWVSYDLGDAAAYGPLLWVGNTGSLMTRAALRVELAVHMQWVNSACHPWCDCDDCFAVPF